MIDKTKDTIKCVTVSGESCYAYIKEHAGGYEYQSLSISDLINILIKKGILRVEDLA